MKNETKPMKKPISVAKRRALEKARAAYNRTRARKSSLKSAKTIVKEDEQKKETATLKKLDEDTKNNRWRKDSPKSWDTGVKVGTKVARLKHTLTRGPRAKRLLEKNSKGR